jgi:transglutaminase/protease-like cytokinesis protein 3
VYNKTIIDFYLIGVAFNRINSNICEQVDINCMIKRGQLELGWVIGDEEYNHVWNITKIKRFRGV